MTEQKTLFDRAESALTPKARRSDPQTSHDAAASISPEHITRLKAAILGAYKQHGQMIDEQLCRVLSGIATDSGIRGRRAELAAVGLVAPVYWGATILIKPTRAGRMSTVWELA